MNVALIREFCKARNMTIMEFEKRSGLSNGTVGTWDKETKKAPRADTLKKAADFMGVKMDDLMREEE